MTGNPTTVKERLLIFIASQNISKAEFSRKMGLSSAYVAAMRKSLPEEKVKRLTDIFPRLNRDWLLYGEGEMLLPDPSESCRQPAGDSYLVPLLPVEAFAGGLQNYSCGVSLPDCDFVASPVKGADFAIHITGDSMEPKIHNGSMAAISRIDDRAFIPWGNPMVIDTCNGVLVKVVYPSDKGEDYIEARSYNPDYPDIQIPKRTVFGLYRIVAIMQKMVTM